MFQRGAIRREMRKKDDASLLISYNIYANKKPYDRYDVIWVSELLREMNFRKIVPGRK